MNNILSDLNEVQRQAVESINGPVMVIAGAGSGKTRVLTYRVAHLINTGVDPFNVLALTFTNKAAREMKGRILQLVGNSDARNVWMGTFHSVFSKILRIDGHLLGYPSNYTIYDTDDSKSLIKTILKELDLDPKVYQPNVVLDRISACKSSLIPAEDYIINGEFQEQDRAASKPKMGEIMMRYKNRCFKAQAMDFDDLLFNTNVLLRDFPEILYKYQQKFRYILVDEYQDTNFAQYMIIKKLAARFENICVVGDDAQSIYAFRGANIQNILNFKNDYPDLKTFKLEQNYRSTQTIVKAANSIIVNNKEQIFKEVWTENAEGVLIPVLHGSSDNEEGRMIAQSIFETKMYNQLPNDAFAILYRTNAQSRSIEEALRKLNIPYRIYGGLSFYKRKEIKDLLAYFRLAINLNDEEALNRIINYPARGIGKTSLEHIIVKANEENKSQWEVISEGKMAGINTGTLTKISEFVLMIKSFRAQLKTRNAYDLAKHIASSSGIMKELYEDKTPEGLSRYENIEELLNAIKDFSEKEPEPSFENGGEISTSIRTLDEFMQDIALLTDADNDNENDNDKVALMTIHSAKGLEFPYVYITGMEENLFPSMQSLSSRSDLEEERRLFYVALTRARIRVTLTYADMRYRWGTLTPCEPSRFIDEIDTVYLDIPRKAPSAFEPSRSENGTLSGLPASLFQQKNLKRLDKVSPASSTTDNGGSFEPSDAADIQPGMEVDHQKFGRGKVLNVEGDASNRKATVFFNGIGQKQLLLKFAKLKIIKAE